jgi:hypothetical protein
MLPATHSNMGTCYICHKTINADNAATHFKNCSQTALDVESERVFLLKVATENHFWLFVRANGDTTLKNLYLFLRNNWYECCGHMSQFYIGEQVCDEQDMHKTLQEMLGVGKTFHYEHNSGTAVRVLGEVLEVNPGRFAQEMQLVLKKNILEERCESCEKMQ